MNPVDKNKYLNSYLLIGNSRWHWAFKDINGWEFLDTKIHNERLNASKIPLLAWAAVGEIPKDIILNKSLQISLTDVPLLKMPSWLGIDRALGGWRAFKKAKESSTLHPNGLLVADAGTILSITKISANGEFLGGQLSAGLDLQLRAMSQYTQNLSYPYSDDFPNERFPKNTSGAMKQGCLQGLAGCLKKAQEDAKAPIFICGGDAQIIFDCLKKDGLEMFLHPNLVLEGMIDITN